MTIYDNLKISFICLMDEGKLTCPRCAQTEDWKKEGSKRYPKAVCGNCGLIIEVSSLNNKNISYAIGYPVVFAFAFLFAYIGFLVGSAL